MTFSSFYGPSHFLMGAGPSPLHPRVLSALSRPLISHLSPLFKDLFFEIKDLLGYVMKTSSPYVLPIQGPGSMAMEACIGNLIEPGDEVVVCDHGLYGSRFKDMVELYGGKVIHLTAPWGTVITPDELEDTLRKNPKASVVCMVHGESSTGVLMDLERFCAVAKKYQCLTVCDIAATLGGSPVLCDAWEIDAAYSNAQKCLSAPPGISPLMLSRGAVYKIKKRKTKIKGWMINLLPAIQALENPSPHRIYPHTSSSSIFYGLHEALLMLYEETLENSWKRHDQCGRALNSGLMHMGFSMIPLQSQNRIPHLNVFPLPHGLSVEQMRDTLSTHYRLEISDGLGKWKGKTCRIGAMGYGCNPKNILFLLHAVGQSLQHFGIHVNMDKILHAAEFVLQNNAAQEQNRVLHHDFTSSSYAVASH